MSVEKHAFIGWVSDLARKHTTALASVARREGLSSDDALDAVQEAFQTFLIVPQARYLSEEHDDARAFLVVLVRNAARNMRRRHFRSRPHANVDELPGLVDDMPAVDALLVQAEAHVALIGCVNRLGDVQRRVVTLRMLEQLSGEAAAAELQLTVSHVAVLLHRAKKELLRCIDTPM